MVTTATNLGSLESIPQARWDMLSTKRIFFGHQSVGADVIDGINDITKQFPRIRLSIRHTRAPEDFARPMFAESNIGKNGDPKSKIDDFRKVMESGVGSSVDIAFFKLCYVDIGTRTDVDALFAYYKTVMDGLRAEFPKVRFVHSTAPLTRMDSELKLAIKKLLGRDGGAAANLKRMAYNRMLVGTYGSEGNVFDIARYESTLPDETRIVHQIDGRDCLGLAPGYTNDGGHLNRTGRVIVAKELLQLLQATP